MITQKGPIEKPVPQPKEVTQFNILLKDGTRFEAHKVPVADLQRIQKGRTWEGINSAYEKLNKEFLARYDLVDVASQKIILILSENPEAKNAVKGSWGYVAGGGIHDDRTLSRERFSWNKDGMFVIPVYEEMGWRDEKGGRISAEEGKKNGATWMANPEKLAVVHKGGAYQMKVKINDDSIYRKTPEDAIDGQTARLEFDADSISIMDMTRRSMWVFGISAATPQTAHSEGSKSFGGFLRRLFGNRAAGEAAEPQITQSEEPKIETIERV
jgi:hypothetical protein